MRIVNLLFGIVALVSMTISTKAQESPFFVIDYGFSYSSSLKEELPEAKRLSPPIQRRVPLYFWTRVAGDESALEILRPLGEVPIRHRWFVRCAVSSNEEDVIQEADIYVGGRKAPPEEWQKLISALQSEIATNRQNGRKAIFDWRTQSRKEYVPSCNYQVLVSEREKVIRCEKLQGPCDLSFRVNQ